MDETRGQDSRLGRRQFLVGSGRAVALVAAMGGAASTFARASSATAAPRPKRVSGSPQRGGELTFGVWTEEAGLNPTVDAWTSVGHTYASALYDPLFALDAQGSIVPYLARFLDHDEEYTTWTIGLREGVQFHDGDPVGADAVVANLEAHAAGGGVIYLAPELEDISAVDPLTVRIVLKQPWPAFPASLVSGSSPSYVVSTKMLTGEQGATPIGTGPFVYEDWQPGVQLTATRNESYWRSDIPYLDRVRFRPILDSTQRSTAVRTGDVDVIIGGSTIDDLAALRDDDSLQYLDDSGQTVLQPHLVMWQPNLAVPPLDDVRIRRALTLALDQRQYSELVFGGLGSAIAGDEFVPVTGPFMPDSPYFTETGYPTEPDVEEATRLVAEYTAENGRPSFTVTAITEPRERTALELAKSMWEPLGIDVTIEQLDPGTLVADLVYGRFEVTFVDAWAAIDPDQNRIFWDPRAVVPPGEFCLNFAHNDDERLVPLLDRGRRSTDPDERAAAYREISELLAEQAAYVYMGRGVGATIAGQSVGGLGEPTDPDGNPLYFSGGGIAPASLWRR